MPLTYLLTYLLTPPPNPSHHYTLRTRCQKNSGYATAKCVISHLTNMLTLSASVMGRKEQHPMFTEMFDKIFRVAASSIFICPDLRWGRRNVDSQRKIMV